MARSSPRTGGQACSHCHAVFPADAPLRPVCPLCGQALTVAPPSGSQWYYARGGKAFGPYSSAQLRELAGTGKLLPTDQVQRVGATHWVAAAQVKHLFAKPPAPKAPATPVAPKAPPVPVAPKPAATPAERAEPTVPCVAATVASLELRVSRQRVLSEAVVVPESGRCVQCGCCTFNCPIGIDVRAHAWRGLPIEDSHCLTCSECVKRCPRGVLSFDVLPVFKR
ncbi:MAG: DUF4339 domain-containing protein [Planctomycetia bacterium]|nr:DUF4339 domain-containing protein [Planctomycetia bacterium]